MQELWSISYLGRPSQDTVVVDLVAGTYSAVATDPDDASVTVTIGNTGLVSVIGGTGPGYTYLDGDDPANYSIMFTPTSGTLTSGTTATWLNLGTNRSFNVAQTTEGSKACEGTLKIRRDSTGTELDSVTITLSATVNPDPGGGGGPPGGGGGGELP